MSGTDWERLRRMTDAEIESNARSDPDNPPTTASFWRNAKVILPERKHLTAIRIDPDVLSWFKAQGKGYQTRMNAVLRAYVAAQSR